MSRTVSNDQDVLDVRDVIARFEELEEAKEAGLIDDEDATELRLLGNFLEELKGTGGDEQWQGDWYPVTLVRESYFKDYAMELAEDIGAIPKDATWPYTCIDWDQAAKELRYDYTGSDFDGVTYWAR